MSKEITVRLADRKDVNAIYGLGVKASGFAVSKKIKFYEKKEIKQWIQGRKNNIVLIAETNSKIVGFAYVKIMSWHWAMVDNFYVLPAYRRKGIGSLIEKSLESELRKKGISYVSRLVKPSHKTSMKFLEKRNFKKESNYAWFDKFLRPE